VIYTGCDADRAALPSTRLRRSCASRRRADGEISGRDSEKAALPENLQLPLVVKPVRQGSSDRGCNSSNARPTGRGALAEALNLIRSSGRGKIIGRETTVGILDGKPLPGVEVRPKVGSYDIGTNTSAGCTEYVLPGGF